MKRILQQTTTVLCTVLLASCATTSKTANTSRAQFLDEVWVAPAVRGKAPSELFASVYFSPVSVARLKEQGWWETQNAKTQDQIHADALKLAAYMNAAMNDAARSYQGAGLSVATQPGPGVLVVETAITELLPAKAFWNAAASAAGFVVPGAGMLGMAGSGAISIQGRLRDGGTGAVIATFRDRETDHIALANLDAYTWYHGSEKNIDQFAQKTAQFLNAPAGATVERSAPIELIAF